MESIVLIKGRVKYPITLDPGVWIFDDRKEELESYFHGDKPVIDELEKYTMAASKHWEKEIREGATMPPTLKTERKFEKQRLLEGTFVIPFAPFLENAVPDEEAGTVIVETEDGQLEYTMDEAKSFVLGFSIDGKPIKEGGPCYLYLGDGSNLNAPIKSIRAFTIQ